MLLLILSVLPACAAEGAGYDVEAAVGGASSTSRPQRHQLPITAHRFLKGWRRKRGEVVIVVQLGPDGPLQVGMPPCRAGSTFAPWRKQRVPELATLCDPLTGLPPPPPNVGMPDRLDKPDMVVAVLPAAAELQPQLCVWQPHTGSQSSGHAPSAVNDGFSCRRHR